MQQKIEEIIQQYDIILFDEICVLCNVEILIKYDTQANLNWLQFNHH
jgi:predicted DCC family thiol-disulfide oxidoreductase YuxK